MSALIDSLREHWLVHVMLLGYTALMAYHAWKGNRETEGMTDYYVGGRKMGGIVLGNPPAEPGAEGHVVFSCFSVPLLRPSSFSVPLLKPYCFPNFLLSKFPDFPKPHAFPAVTAGAGSAGPGRARVL